MKKALIRTKDTAQNLMDDGQVTPEEYASDQMKYAAQDTAETAEHTVKSGVNRAKEKAKEKARIHSFCEERRVVCSEDKLRFMGDLLCRTILISPSYQRCIKYTISGIIWGRRNAILMEIRD